MVAVGTADKKPADGSVYGFDRIGNQIWSDEIGAPVWSVSLSAGGHYLAVASWNNRAYRFVRQGASYRPDGEIHFLNASGLYGIRLSPDGDHCALCCYEEGIRVLDHQRNVVAELINKLGLYNVALANARDEIVASSRNGSLVLASAETLQGEQSPQPVAPRPICGAAVSDDGELLALGSFDGRLYVTTREGRSLWEFETDGEIWSTAISTDGALVCLGSGDHAVRLFESHCHSAALAELKAAERCVGEASGVTLHSALEDLVALYLKHGLVAYGSERLKAFAVETGELLLFKKSLQKLLEDDIRAYPQHHRSHFELGTILKASEQCFEAASHFQKAAGDPRFRSRAMVKAAECFGSLRLPTATSTSFRRGRERHLDVNAKQVLHYLARAYEKQGWWADAARIYELLVSWDANYRNAWFRLQQCQDVIRQHLPERSGGKTDYTGLTVTLLGPDTPRDVDQSLLKVLEARNAESLMAPEERSHVESIVSQLLSDTNFSRGVTRKLDYTTELFLKYDFGLPEDEIKKFLETVNTLSMLGDASIDASLDIGAATGRYPFLFATRGIKAHGVDIEARAVEVANKKREKERPGEEWPKFLHGDAQQLSFPAQSFDLVTCMMGTFAHIQRSEQSSVLNRIIDVLRPGGFVVISTWDVECEHLASLSMYNEDQKEAIRKQSPTQKEIRELYEKAGFENIVVRPFSLLPQATIYDLGIEGLRTRDIQMAAHTDLAARAMFADKHGEMYLAVGQKPLA